MCGIIAATTRTPVSDYLVEGLARLEYRGYDSVGLAIAGATQIVLPLRSVQRVDDLRTRMSELSTAKRGTIGVGHTRWATHGKVSVRNAHPHTDCTGRLAIVHNGVIENADELRALLTHLGHTFSSEVDSEVIAHLVEEALGDGLLAAVSEAVSQLRGSWAVAVLDAASGELVAATHESPLVVAHGREGHFLASDVGAIAPWIETFQVLGDGDVVEVSAGGRWLRPGGADEPAQLPCPDGQAELALGVHADFMSKEIEEQPEVAARVIAALGPRIADGELWRSLELPDFDRVAILGCGTSLNAGRAIGSVLTRLSGIPHHAVVASEAAETVVEPRTLVLALSQSGETADVLRALNTLEASGAPVLGITNVAHSALSRRADAVVDCLAGPEIGVAATKTFMGQLVAGTCVVLSALAARGTLARADLTRLVADLDRVPDLLAQAIGASRHTVGPVVDATAKAGGFLYLGRGPGLVYADEGALKLKELTYRWAESYPAGELKHGPLALVEHGTPVLVVDDAMGRLAVDIAEVEARGGHVIRIGGPESTIPAMGTPGVAVDGLPWCGPFESVIAMQVFARELALVLGRDVDKPRNLAKSVTVH